MKVGEWVRKKKKVKYNPVPLVFKCISPIPDRKKESCCVFILEHNTQLVPPAKKGSVKVKKELFAEIEKVCKGAIVICGVLKKTLLYISLDAGKQEEIKIIDEVPFQCLIEDKDAKEGDIYKIDKKSIICEVFGEERNFGKDKQTGTVTSFNYNEKDLIEVCVKKVKRYD